MIGFLGKDVILPCTLTTSRVLDGTKITVQWVLTNPSEKIYVYHRGKKEETQNRLYQGRMELFDSELSKGNMSLKLRSSQLSDQGKYICMITLENWYDEVTVDLKLTGELIKKKHYTRQKYSQFPWSVDLLLMDSLVSRADTCAICRLLLVSATF